MKKKLDWSFKEKKKIKKQLSPQLQAEILNTMQSIKTMGNVFKKKKGE